MHLSEFNGELNMVIRAGLVALFAWIHSNPTGTASQAKVVAKTWLASNAPEYDTQPFADKLVDRVLSLGNGTWAGFRDLVLMCPSALADRFADSVWEDRPFVPAELVRDWLIENGGIRTETRDSSGVEWKRNCLLRVEITNGEYTVRQDFLPILEGQKAFPNPQGWELV